MWHFQLGLALSTGGALMLLDTLGGAQQAGQNMLSSVRDAEKAVEEKIWKAVAEGQRVAKVCHCMVMIALTGVWIRMKDLVGGGS